jgi:hypothetical protein
MNMKRILIFVSVVLLALTLGGCAGIQKQAFNKDANQDIKTIGPLEQIEQEKYFVQNMGHPGMGFGLIGGLIAVADMESKQNKLTELMKARNLNVIGEFQGMLATDLENVGYAVKMLKPQRAKPALLEKYDGLDNEVDAYLDFTVSAGYMCASATADYIPTVHTIARLVKRGTSEILYEEVIYYGYQLKAKEAACITADQQYYFKDFGTLTSNADLAMEGIRKGVPLITKHIAQSLAR